MFASDRDRERAVEALRGHYVRGRLSLDELSSRTELVLTARSRAELRRAFAGLSLVPDADELIQRGRSIVAVAVRSLALLVLTATYLLFTLVLIVLVPFLLFVHSATGSTLVGLLVVWLVPTYLLSRLWYRGPRRRSP